MQDNLEKKSSSETRGFFHIKVLISNGPLWSCLTKIHGGAPDWYLACLLSLPFGWSEHEWHGDGGGGLIRAT